MAKAVPGIDQMIGAAPKMEGSSSSLGNISSMMGSNKLGGMAGLTSSFEKLGLSGETVSKFTPIILDYVKNKEGEHAMNLLKGKRISRNSFDRCYDNVNIRGLKYLGYRFFIRGKCISLDLPF